MMPTHGYGKFRRLLLGSVTAKVLHDAKCPVWTATHAEGDMVNHVGHNSIMGAIDQTPDTALLIRRYAEIAREFNAKLRLVHALPGAHPDAMRLDEDFHRFLINSAREDIARIQAEAGTNLELCMEGGAVSKVVREASLHHDADLILIGRGILHERFGQLRTNAYAIIRDAPCPVLSL
jgi:nucleotide-binding universal stress UspA family protein